MEKVLSLVSAQWFKVRNRQSEKTVKSIVQVKVNGNEMHRAISQDKALLNSRPFLVQNKVDN